MESKPTLEDIVSLCKRRGFIYQGSEIYGGLAGTWDYGPLGTLLKRNIVNAWLKFFVDGWDDMYQIDSAVLMNQKVWQASGHTETFNDPMVECSNCHARLRADHILEDALNFNENELKQAKCPNCGQTGTLGHTRQFNLMFETRVGPVIETDFKQTSENSAEINTNVISGTDTTYLRPETAQGMFVNFKNILDSFSPDLPFGIAQVGKAFRNEISPRDFLFRAREFEIMEFEFFIHPNDWEKYFEKWRGDMHSWFKVIGLPEDKIKEIEVPENDRAHYSKRTIDFEFSYPFGVNEIAGVAYRTDFDLKNHQEKSGKNLEYRPKDGSDPFIPHVIEPTFGVDRHVLAVLANAYTVEPVDVKVDDPNVKVDDDVSETRIVLKLPAKLAPVKVAVFPLLKNKPELVAKAKEVYKLLQKQVDGEVMWDDNGNIGKRYRRQDEIGTPYCVTIDFQTLEDDTVTVRSRDTTEQQRIATDDIWNGLK